MKLRYGRGLHTPANYVMNYNPSPVEKGAEWNVRAEAKLAEIGDEIKARKERVRKNIITASNLYKDIGNLDEAFYADEKCTGCGQCERICPARNIKMSDGRPEWQHKYTAAVNACWWKSRYRMGLTKKRYERYGTQEYLYWKWIYRHKMAV